MEGQGEILRIEDTPAHGTRDLTIDANSKLITDEIFQTLPEPYRVGRYGYSPNKVALTFDDGPDPEWTPKILDVLKREACDGNIFSDRHSDGQVFRRRETHLQRRPHHREPHLHASRRQQYFDSAT